MYEALWARWTSGMIQAMLRSLFIAGEVIGLVLWLMMMALMAWTALFRPTEPSIRVYTRRDPNPLLLILGSLFGATVLLALLGLAIKLYR
jgi:hypothetical protein